MLKKFLPLYFFFLQLTTFGVYFFPFPYTYRLGARSAMTPNSSEATTLNYSQLHLSDFQELTPSFIFAPFLRLQLWKRDSNSECHVKSGGSREVPLRERPKACDSRKNEFPENSSPHERVIGAGGGNFSAMFLHGLLGSST